MSWWIKDDSLCMTCNRIPDYIETAYSPAKLCMTAHVRCHGEVERVDLVPHGGAVELLFFRRRPEAALAKLFERGYSKGEIWSIAVGNRTIDGRRIDEELERLATEPLEITHATREVDSEALARIERLMGERR